MNHKGLFPSFVSDLFIIITLREHMWVIFRLDFPFKRVQTAVLFNLMQYVQEQCSFTYSILRTAGLSFWKTTFHKTALLLSDTSSDCFHPKDMKFDDSFWNSAIMMISKHYCVKCFLHLWTGTQTCFWMKRRVSFQSMSTDDFHCNFSDTSIISTMWVIKCL